MNTIFTINHSYPDQRTVHFEEPVTLKPEPTPEPVITNKQRLVDQQVSLASDLISAGINLVTCGHCGCALLHKVDAEVVECPECETTQDPCDCPDLWFKGCYIPS